MADRSEEELALRIKAMDETSFERMVAALARREGKARRLKAPDGGADTVRIAAGDVKAKVWQAKHHTVEINWGDCEQSLDRAVDVWKPVGEVIFVFPIDFTKNREQTFQTRLVGRHPGVDVDAWTLDDLLELLDRHDDIRTRFFKEHENLSAPIERLIAMGGKELSTPEDARNRAREIAEFTETVDQKFTYKMSFGGEESPPDNFEKLPYVTMVVEGERVDVYQHAWAREGFEVESPTFVIPEGDAARLAHEEVIRALARGEEAKLTGEAGLYVQLPEIPGFMKDVPEPGKVRTGAIAAPKRSEVIEVKISSCEDAVTYEVTTYAAPGPEPGTFAYVGHIGETLVQFTFKRMEYPQMYLNFALAPRFGLDTHHATVATAELMRSLMTADKITYTNDSLFGGEAVQHDVGMMRNPEQAAFMSWWIDVASDLALIEDTLGVSLPLPQTEYPANDLRTVAATAALLRGEEAEHPSFFKTTVEVLPHDIPGAPERRREEGPERATLKVTIFGQEIVLGEAEMDIPPLKVTNIVPMNPADASSPALVRLEHEGDGLTTFRLIDPPAAPKEESASEEPAAQT